MRLPSRGSVLNVLGWTLRVVLILILGGLVVTRLVARHRVERARSEFTRVFGSVDPAAWSTRDDERQRNAARLFVAAGFALDVRKEEEPVLLGGLLDAQRAASQQVLLERNRMSLALAEEAGAVPYARFGWHPGGPLPPLRPLLQVSYLLAANARVAAARGDAEAALRSLRALVRLATLLESEGPLVCHMIGTAVERPAVELAAAWAADPARTDPAFLDAVRQALPAADLARTFRDARAREAIEMVRGVQGGLTDFGLTAVVLWPIGELVEAELLQSASRNVALSEGRMPWSEAAAPEPSMLRPHAAIAWIAGTGADRHVIFVALTEAQRRLVKSALVVRSAGLRAHAYPAELPPDAPGRENDPLTRKRLAYAPGADGSVTLRLPIGPDLEPYVGQAIPSKVVLPPVR